jgi:hypothetical protein
MRPTPIASVVDVDAEERGGSADAPPGARAHVGRSRTGRGAMGHLDAAGLTPEEIAHFEAHGWILLERRSRRDPMPDVCGYHRHNLQVPLKDWHRSSNVTWLHNTHLLGDVYLDWFMLPGSLRPAANSSVSAEHGRTDPLQRSRRRIRAVRTTAGEVLNPDGWPWHGDTNDKSLANQNEGVNFATFLFPAGRHTRSWRTGPGACGTMDSERSSCRRQRKLASSGITAQ